MANFVRVQNMKWVFTHSRAVRNRPHKCYLHGNVSHVPTFFMRQERWPNWQRLWMVEDEGLLNKKGEVWMIRRRQCGLQGRRGCPVSGEWPDFSHGKETEESWHKSGCCDKRARNPQGLLFRDCLSAEFERGSERDSRFGFLALRFPAELWWEVCLSVLEKILVRSLQGLSSGRECRCYLSRFTRPQTALPSLKGTNGVWQSPLRNWFQFLH